MCLPFLKNNDLQRICIIHTLVVTGPWFDTYYEASPLFFETPQKQAGKICPFWAKNSLSLQKEMTNSYWSDRAKRGKNTQKTPKSEKNR